MTVAICLLLSYYVLNIVTYPLSLCYGSKHIFDGALTDCHAGKKEMTLARNRKFVIANHP